MKFIFLPKNLEGIEKNTIFAARERTYSSEQSFIAEIGANVK